ncbi:MAG: hypothetical protein SVU32_05545 [Candidatus Nanohaloarchaea archaeon]|nr:hypothetical protein [Candidatus Nanohaloarchaea archaeon]
MNRKAVLAFVLIAVIAISGCTAQNNGGDTGDNGDQQQPQVDFTQTDGITMRFSSVAPEYFEGQTATFRLIAENTGESEATLKKAELTRQPWLANKQDTGQYTLRGVDRSVGSAGQAHQYTFTKTLSQSLFDLSQGQSDTYEVGARLVYGYSTSARTSLTVMDRETFTSEQPTQQPLQTEWTGAPVKVSLQGSTPVQASAGQTTIKVKIQNVGNGHIKESGQAGVVTVDRMELATSGTGSFNCNLQGNTVKIYQGGSRTLYCTLNINSMSGGQTSVTVISEISYDYVETKTTTVKVNGQASSSN